MTAPGWLGVASPGWIEYEEPPEHHPIVVANDDGDGMCSVCWCGDHVCMLFYGPPPCDVCGMSGLTDRHHKMSCPRGASRQGRVTASVAMLREYGPEPRPGWL